jgi:catechol 2,3-dioxygenase-like lactoylglutathione lyase family enzyme
LAIRRLASDTGSRVESGTLLFVGMETRASMAATSGIMGIAEIVLNVRDLPAMRDFYREVLGFRVLSEACHERGIEPDPDGEPTIVFLTIHETDTPLGRHGQMLALIDFRRHVFAKERFDGHEPTRSTLNHLAFEIRPEDYEAEKERLDKLGLNPRPATFPAMAARALFFNDPEQNLLELICHAPPGAQYKQES